MNIAKVITELALDREFDYLIPRSLSKEVAIGTRVVVPFGKATREGVVVAFAEKSKFPNLKEIASVVNSKPILSNKLLSLGKWISDYYCCSTEQTIRTLIPGVVRTGRVKPKMISFITIPTDIDLCKERDALPAQANKQRQIIEYILKNGSVSKKRLLQDVGVSSGPLKNLTDNNVLKIEGKIIESNPFENKKVVLTADKSMTDEQNNALKIILTSMDKKSKSDVVLIDGVTGSGKTEIYLQAIRECLNRGKEAIVLVPEIALTPQTARRFRSRFGEKVSVMHSGLTDRERYDEWMKIYNKKVSIVVGARSALFAPFESLDLIIVDEEHENTYKQEETPRYNARDVAVMRGFLENITIVLGSATPSFESMNNAKIGKYKLAQLKKRIDKKAMPEIKLIDLRIETQARGQFSIFSATLVDEIFDRLRKKEQVILFLNRRGFATHMQCLKCGFTAECEHCSCALTYHQKRGVLTCHFCGYTLKAYEKCPSCFDKGIKYGGIGTEKIESIAKNIFSSAKIARMDSDTMTTAKSYKKVLNQFQKEKIDILIGTQMIAKGLHFTKVTLVGIMNADAGLHIPDFRAAERTFQLITQVSGRCGRGDVKGEVVVQTFSPLNPALQHAVNYRYEEFYESEMDGRKVFNYPPIIRMIMIRFKGKNEEMTERTATELYLQLKPVFGKHVLCSAPMPSPMAKIKGKYRFQMILRTKQILPTVRYLRQLLVGGAMNKNVYISVDVDPYSML
ncbi:MAG: primosomal protein N' [Verrucomicrobiota bacterium]|nr:primosomal protein N' [Verrucomicrobiota bacterium]